MSRETKRVDAVTVVCHYAPDMARQGRALLAVLRSHETPSPANEGMVEEGETETPRSNAPAVETTGAQDHTSTLSRSAAIKQGSSHDTTPHP
jgi:hypothetical protein